MKPSLVAIVFFASTLGGTCFAEGAAAVSPSAPPTPAAGATRVAAATPAKPGYNPDAQICKWTEELGSLLGRTKTCMTRAQWDELGRSGQEQLNDASRRSGEMGVPGG